MPNHAARTANATRSHARALEPGPSQAPAASAPSARDRLIDAALRVFNERGFKAAGIEAILERAGVAKMSLYNNFQGKDELIVAALQRREDQWMAWFVPAVEAAARAANAAIEPAPADRLLAVFDVLTEWFGQADFNGCGFIRVCGEFPAAEDAAHQAGVAHKNRVEACLGAWASEAGAQEPELVARALFGLVAGAIVCAQMARDAGPAGDAKVAARALLRAHGIA